MVFSVPSLGDLNDLEGYEKMEMHAALVDFLGRKSARKSTNTLARETHAAVQGYDRGRGISVACSRGATAIVTAPWDGITEEEYLAEEEVKRQAKLAELERLRLLKEEELRKTGNLFQEPDSTLLLASGMGRHWPDGRGVFHNEAKNLFVWVGEEDHLRIVSMQGSRSAPSAEGKNIKEVTARFMTACAEVQKVL